VIWMLRRTIIPGFVSSVVTFGEDVLNHHLNADFNFNFVITWHILLIHIYLLLQSKVELLLWYFFIQFNQVYAWYTLENNNS
jgi:hypothetical protein